ncbi:MAG: tetratricopeptide repeat protein, partial [Rhizobiaceae bacterium]|nr:tetratricopeptide repeat protein [Rhizobiaceae bacterium]
MIRLSDDQIHSALTRTTWIARRTAGHGRKLLHKLLNRDPERGLALVLDLAPAIGDPLGRLASEWLEQHPINPNHARQLEQSLPEHSLALREFAMVVTRNALMDRYSLTEAQQAASLNNLAGRLSDLGQREAALEASQEAMALFRKLAEARADAFTPDLARSLSNLASRLSDLGQRESALEAAQKAVALFRKLAE